jgi:hypothetical protein
MKIILIISTVILSSCSYLKYELDYASQRSEAKSYEDYAPWARAKLEVVSRCSDVSSIYQGHSRVVGVSFKGGPSITTISPEIDMILDVIRSCRGSYEGIVILME